MKKNFNILFYIMTGILTAAVTFVCIILAAAWYAYFLVFAALAVTVVLRVLKKASGARSAIAFALLIVCAALSLTVCRGDMAVSLRSDYYRSFTRFFMFSYNATTGSTYFGDMLDSQASEYAFGDWNAPHGYTNEEIALPNARGYMLKKQGGEHSKIVYQIHGGGYVSKFSDTYNQTAVLFSEAYGGADVFSLDYRTAPDDPFPAALNDAEDGYKYLLECGYNASDIFIAGDSAGGGLSLSLALKLRDDTLPLPAGLILSSPFTDHTASGSSYKTNATKDIFFGGWSAENVPVPVLKPAYSNGHDLNGPYLSPAFGNYADMPPMLMLTGSDEMLLSDSEVIEQRMTESDRDVTLTVYHGMYHTFNIVTPSHAESRAAWLETKEFIARIKNG